jgi:hypothetical protein
MGDKIDDLFSPERLRSHWDRDRAGAPTEPAAPRPLPDAVALARRLRALAQERYAGAAGTALQQLVERLDALVGRRWAEEPQPEEDLAALDAEIELLLGQVEDLSEALEIGRNA